MKSFSAQRTPRTLRVDLNEFDQTLRTLRPLREHRVRFVSVSRKAEVGRLEKLTGKAAKPPAAGGGGDKKLTADEWLAEELKKGK